MRAAYQQQLDRYRDHKQVRFVRNQNYDADLLGNVEVNATCLNPNNNQQKPQQQQEQQQFYSKPPVESKDCFLNPFV